MAENFLDKTIRFAAHLFDTLGAENIKFLLPQLLLSIKHPIYLQKASYVSEKKQSATICVRVKGGR